MTSVLPPRRPLLSPPLYLLLSLGLGLGLVLCGLAALLFAVALLSALLSMPRGFSLVLPLLLITPLLALQARGLLQLRRALTEAQHIGPFGAGLSERVRRGARDLLAVALLLVPLGGLAVWLLTPRAGQEGVTVNSALGASDAVSALVAALYWIAMPLLLLGLADWVDRGGQLMERQREVV